jgi:hypothetical protein
MPSMDRLTHAIATVAGFRKNLLMMLGASSVSALRYAVRIELALEERLLYLNPIRDVFDDSAWIDNQIRLGARVALVGVDAMAIVNRIIDPNKYWTDKDLNVWLIIMK